MLLIITDKLIFAGIFSYICVPKKLCIRWECTLAPPSKYGWMAMCGSYQWVCHWGQRCGYSQITLGFLVSNAML